MRAKVHFTGKLTIIMGKDIGILHVLWNCPYFQHWHVNAHDIYHILVELELHFKDYEPECVICIHFMYTDITSWLVGLTLELLFLTEDYRSMSS